MNKMKKAVIIILSVTVLLFLPYIVNDIACNIYKNRIENKILYVPEAKILQSVSGCGNSGGTGNHTDTYAAFLIETELSEKEIKETFSDASYVEKVSSTDIQTLAMQIINLKFENSALDSSLNHYIIEYAEYAPFSAFDLRGH